MTNEERISIFNGVWSERAQPKVVDELLKISIRLRASADQEDHYYAEVFEDLADAFQSYSPED